MTYLIGQPRVSAALENALAHDRLGHGLLFVGEAGVGRERAALGLAGALLCERRGEPQAAPWGCGACGACRRARAGAHPDLHLVMSEAEAVRRGRAEPDGKRRPSQDILVDALRDLSVRLRMTAYQGGYRVAVVVDAHRMNVNAQNALLKTLEEPGERTVVILMAPHERAVLPTIASRCLRLSFQPLAERDLRAILGGLGTPDAELRARRARGSVARALALDLSAASGGDGDGDGVKALWDALLGEAGDVGPLAACLDAAEAVGKERSDVEQALTRLEQRLADAARAGAAGGGTPSWRQASALLERVGRARTAIAHNASVQLALEELLLGRGLAARPATR
ncbi:MAG: DNA polymerase III subunit delta' [Deltaproteobacteria bacterium]|nr:DNA polymerase III subunit delta' [Deltaproteobacteria bacterium]